MFLYVSVARCLFREDITLHIDEVEPVDGDIKKYGFVQQIHAFVVNRGTRQTTTGKLGMEAADLLFKTSL